MEGRIVFIPKPGKEANQVSNLRPLSLLENMYKIKTRILNERMAGIMEKILYPDQHVFAGNGAYSWPRYLCLRLYMMRKGMADCCSCYP
jgi:hypothetical protein